MLQKYITTGVVAVAAAARTYVAPPHVLGYPTRVPPFVTVHQPRYLINKGMMTPSPPLQPPTPARRFSNNDDDDDNDGRNVCGVYIYTACMIIITIIIITTDKSIIFQNEISASKTYYYLLYILLLPVCTDGTRNTAWCIPTIHTYYILYTYWYNILVLYTHYIYHIIRALRHTLRMRRGKRYSVVSTTRDRYPVWRRFPARRRSVYTHSSREYIVVYRRV